MSATTVSLRAVGQRVLWGTTMALALSTAQAQAAKPAAADRAPWPPSTEAVRDARAWLVRSHEAASSRNYQGVLVSSTEGQSSSSRVAHYVEGPVQAERIDALDGEDHDVLRLNDTVHTLWPRTKLAVVEQRDVRANFPSIFSDSERQVLDSYEFQPIGKGRVAGFDADVVLLKARDPLRYSERLWAERQTGLLLRTDILGPQGKVLESSAFSELQLDVAPQIDAVRAQLGHLAGYRVVRPVSMPVSLAAEGWQMPHPPAGFHEVQCHRRSLDPLEGSRSPVVLQAVFSDGLTYLSLFIEPYQPGRHQGPASHAIGATHTLMMRRGPDWITVIGDVPADTLKALADALERRH